MTLSHLAFFPITLILLTTILNTFYTYIQLLFIYHFSQLSFGP
jgi:hypothetical protein